MTTWGAIRLAVGVILTCLGTAALALSVPAALAAATIALSQGLALADVAAALSAARARSHWRMELSERPDGVLVVNDAYNANPDSMAAALIE